MHCHHTSSPLIIIITTTTITIIITVLRKMDIDTKRWWTIFYVDSSIETWLGEMRQAFNYQPPLSLLPSSAAQSHTEAEKMAEKTVLVEELKFKKFSAAKSYCESISGKLCSLGTIRRHFASMSSQDLLDHSSDQHYTFWTNHSCSNCWKVACQSCAEVKERARNRKNIKEEKKEGFWGEV